MGFIRERQGRCHTESRTESFYLGVYYEEPKDPLPRAYNELLYEDLEDLIKVLIDLRDKDDQYRRWLEQHSNPTGGA